MEEGRVRLVGRRSEARLIQGKYCRLPQYGLWRKSNTHLHLPVIRRRSPWEARPAQEEPRRHQPAERRVRRGRRRRHEQSGLLGGRVPVRARAARRQGHVQAPRGEGRPGARGHLGGADGAEEGGGAADGGLAQGDLKDFSG